jgi:ribosomal subunit interface protein
MAPIDNFLGETTKLEIYINDIREGDKAGVDKKVEAVTKSFGKVIRISETSDNIPGAIDQLKDKLERSLRKRKEKRIDRQRRTKGFLKRLLPTNWFDKND